MYRGLEQAQADQYGYSLPPVAAFDMPTAASPAAGAAGPMSALKGLADILGAAQAPAQKIPSAPSLPSIKGTPAGDNGGVTAIDPSIYKNLAALLQGL